MHKYFAKVIGSILKYFWYLLSAGLIILVIWQVIQTIDVPNLLQNPDFKGDQITEWHIISQGSPQATANLLHNNDNPSLQLYIPNTTEGSWVGVGQRILVKPNQNYLASIDYQLVAENQSSSTVILRVSHYNDAGDLIKTEDIPAPSPLTANPPNNTQQWNRLTHNFVTGEQTVAIEFGVGLFGHQATTIELGNTVFAEDPNWLTEVRQDPVILLLALLLASRVGYETIRRIIPPLLIKITQVRLNRRLIIIIIVNVIVFFVFAELVALGIYFIRDGKLFYTNRQTYELIEDEAETGELTPRRIHPYFGYIDKPGWQQQSTSPLWREIDAKLKTVNNQGLNSNYDYPFTKNNDNQYIIGVFGGSVAELFALSAQDELIKNLQKHDFFADKEIIVLNFAKAGYKQPQQLLVLAYFLSIGQEFDMVINVDGFNEVVFGDRNNQNGLDYSMPYRSFIGGLAKLTNQSTLTPEKLETLSQINRYKARLNKLSESINHNHIASVNFVLEQYYAFVFNNYSAELTKFDEFDLRSSETSLLFLKSNDELLEDPILLERTTDLWATSSIIIHHILTSKGISYFHFLQPNQYYSNKTFSDEEAKIAIDENHWEKFAAEKGYPALTEKFDILAENNVHFFNGIPIFDNESEIVYIDACCHYNKLGNKILAEFIANSILSSNDFDGTRSSQPLKR